MHKLIPSSRNRKTLLRVIYFFLFIIFVTPIFIHFISEKRLPKRAGLAYELYDPELLKLNTTAKLVSYTDSLFETKNSDKYDTLLYVNLLTKVVKERFHHGLAKYTFSENWIAYIMDKVIWSHIGAIVSPDDILQHAEGLCSQQTIVYMEALKVKGINVRSVGLGYKEGPGHFLCEVKYGGSWHLRDVTLEPEWQKVVLKHSSISYYLQNKDSLYVVYNTRLSKPHFYKLMEKVEYGEVNDFPAKNMLIFHHFSLMTTYLLPLFFLVLFCHSIYQSIIEKLRTKTFD